MAVGFRKMLFALEEPLTCPPLGARAQTVLPSPSPCCSSPSTHPAALQSFALILVRSSPKNLSSDWRTLPGMVW